MGTSTRYLPQHIVAGESIWLSADNTAQDAADLTFDDYTPAGGYTLAYSFSASTPLTVAAVANGADTGWTLDVAPAQTILWSAGHIAFAGYVTHTATGRKYVVDQGSIAVAASPLSTSAWTAVIAACDAALLSGASSGMVSFGLDGVNVAYKTTADLIRLRDYAKSMESDAIGGSRTRIIRTRFTL